MGRLTDSFLQSLWHRRALSRWTRLEAQSGSMNVKDLRDAAGQGRQMRSLLDKFLHKAEDRLALPKIGNTSFPRPQGSDWAWRPGIWCQDQETPGISSVTSGEKLGSELAIFHDCPVSEMTLRQIRNTRERDLAAYGLRLDVFKFAGSYLSIALDLPDQAVRGLTRQYIIRCETIVEMEKPLEIFARLNIKHGPNTEQLVQELPLQAEDIRVEFDLAYSRINEKRIQKAWLDLIFEGPEMNQVVLRDVTLSRRLRAQL